MIRAADRLPIGPALEPPAAWSARGGAGAAIGIVGADALRSPVVGHVDAAARGLGVREHAERVLSHLLAGRSGGV